MPHVDEGQLHAYLDGELLALGVSANAFARHLAECDACRERLKEAQRTRGRASAILAESGPPPTEIPPFENVVGARQAAPRRRGISPTALAWAATIVLALGLGWSARTLLTPGSGARQSAEVAEPPSAAEAPIALAEQTPEAEERAARPEGSADGIEAGVRQGAASRPEPEPPLADEARTDSARVPAVKGFQDVAPTAALPPSAAPSSAPPTTARRRERASIAAEDFSGIGVAAPGAPPAVARGRVTDQSGSPLAGATVGVATTNVKTTTGADGRYELAIPAERLGDSTTLSLQATRIGSGMGSATVALAPGREAKQDFLLASDVLQMEAIVVTGSSGKAEAAEAAADAEAPRVLAAALRYLHGRLTASQRDRPMVLDERILSCTAESCAAEPEGHYRDAETLRRVRRDVDITGNSADAGKATAIALSAPRVDGGNAEVAALVDPADAAAYAVRLTLRQAGLRWRVTGERRLGVD
jgi:hypothetical protein